MITVIFANSTSTSRIYSVNEMYPMKFEPILKQTLWGGDKIIPFKRLILGMEKEAKKQAKLDAENAASHKQSMKEGQYGNIRSGDPEEKIPAAMGQPDHVNSSKTSDGEIKQYVFNHNGKNFYVYTKNGVVTEVR